VGRRRKEIHLRWPARRPDWSKCFQANSSFLTKLLQLLLRQVGMALDLFSAKIQLLKIIIYIIKKRKTG
jgi:hypothetical protein